MGDYITNAERLRRIGELLLRGVYLWADTVGGEGVSQRYDPDMANNGTGETAGARSIRGPATVARVIAGNAGKVSVSETDDGLRRRRADRLARKPRGSRSPTG